MRYRFGLKQFVYVIIFVCVTALVGKVDVGFQINSCRIAEPELIISSFFAFTSGPVVGSLIAFLGYVLGRLITGEPYMWNVAFANMVVSLGIGLYAGSFEAYKGNFCGIKYYLFNMIQLISCTFAFLLIYPIISVMLYSVPVNTVLHTGIGLTLVNAIIIGISISALGTIYNAYMRVKIKKQELQEEKQGVN